MFDKPPQRDRRHFDGVDYLVFAVATLIIVLTMAGCTSKPQPMPTTLAGMFEQERKQWAAACVSDIYAAARRYRPGDVMPHGYPTNDWAEVRRMGLNVKSPHQHCKELANLRFIRRTR